MLSLITLALAATSVSGLVVPRSAPSTYGDWLESYDVYHTRYVAIGCTGKQGSDFFDQCCHPLNKEQLLENTLPAQCIPSTSATVSSAAAAATPSSNSEDEDTCEEGDENCVCEDDEDDEPAPSSTSAPAPAATPKPTPTGNGEVHDNGHATFFYQNGVAGACGTVHSDDDFVAALPRGMYGDFGAMSSNCGKMIRVTRKSTGKSVDVKVADGCPSCGGASDLDLSKVAFLEIATLNEGQVEISYTLL